MSRTRQLAAKVLRFGVVPRAKAEAARRVPALGVRASLAAIEARFAEFPLQRELATLHGDHSGEAVLVVGCGTGDDLVGYAVHAGAARVAGVDADPAALEHARARLVLHGVTPELAVVASDAQRLPFDDATFGAVLSHGLPLADGDPAAVARELHRVLRPGGTGRLIVPNRDSVAFHLVHAWERGAAPEHGWHRGDELAEILGEAGFDARYVGGHLSQDELRAMTQSWGHAIADERLASEHRAFLRGLRYDYHHRPMHGDVHAGVGAVLHLRKVA